MIELTELQRQALAAEQERPPRVVDPATQEKYVLLPVKDFERLQALVRNSEDEGFAEEMAPLIWETMKEDWEGMDGFDSASQPKKS